MHHALRSSLAIVAIAACAGCQTHDRRIYTTHKDKNLHSPNPFAPSTTKAADDATSSLAIPPEPADSSNPVAPGSPPAPDSQ
jgi:hypothetical protein